MNYLEHLNMDGEVVTLLPCITGKGVPTSLTEAAVGMFYMDTTTGDVYKCTAASDGAYTWALVGGGNIELAESLSGNEEDKAPSVKAVKAEFDATNAEVDALKDEVFDIGMKVGAANYKIAEQSELLKGWHPMEVIVNPVNNLVFLDRIACARRYSADVAEDYINNNKIKNAHFTPLDEETYEGDYYPTAHSVSVNQNGSNLTINTVGEDDIQLGITMHFDKITVGKGKPVLLACRVLSGSFSSGDGKLRIHIGAGDNSTVLEYPQGDNKNRSSHYVTKLQNSVSSIFINTTDSEGNNITFNNLVLNVYVASEGLTMYSDFPNSVRIERDGEILKTTYGGAALTALKEFAESIGANLDKEISDEEYNVTAYNYIDMKERELVINVEKDETSGKFVACEERRVSVDDILTANDFDGFIPVERLDQIILDKRSYSIYYEKWMDVCYVTGSSYIFVRKVGVK